MKRDLLKRAFTEDLFFLVYMQGSKKNIGYTSTLRRNSFVELPDFSLFIFEHIFNV